MIHIASWNVNSLKVRLPQVLAWLAQRPIDILALQELKLAQDAFPLADIEAAGYHAVWAGQKTYNGVAILSRIPACDVVCDFPDWDDPQRRLIAATVGDIRIVNVYCVNGESLNSEKFTYKINWFRALHRFITQELARYPRLIVLGDFNIAPTDLDVYDPVAWTDKILCSPLERAAFEHLLALGLADSFRLFESDVGHYTWWDYRAAMFRRNLGLRIDHILVSDALKTDCCGCEIDRVPRKNERPSDHAPIVLSLQAQ